MDGRASGNRLQFPEWGDWKGEMAISAVFKSRLDGLFRKRTQKAKELPMIVDSKIKKIKIKISNRS